MICPYVGFVWALDHHFQGKKYVAVVLAKNIYSQIITLELFANKERFSKGSHSLKYGTYTGKISEMFRCNKRGSKRQYGIHSH